MNQPAFPFVAEDETGMMVNMGMDLRDYFASKVTQAILTGSAWNISNPYEVARKAYEYADVMMEVRKNAD
jgi:hypothetical protein